MATPTYNVDYDDERFQQVDTDKNNALSDLEKTYSDMISNSDKYYQDKIDAVDKWEEKQTELQNQQTQNTIDQVNQQKDQAHKDYIKEQSGAYVDWQKQSNQYGAEAEKMASSGLLKTGYSESSQVSMYNTYQNRVATARESYNRAVLNYDNAIKDAQLQNSSVLAEIAYNALQQQLELSLQGFQYKNNLILEQASKKTELENTYYNRWLNVLNQINTENAMAEDVRQFEETQKFNEHQAQLDRDFQSTQAEINRNFEAQQAELDRKFQTEQAELERQHDFAMLEAQTKAEKELLDKQHAQAMAKLKKQQQYEQELLEQEYQNQLNAQAALQQIANNTASTVGSTLKSAITGSSMSDATAYFNAMVAAGKTKTEITNEINAALKSGVITQEEAKKLKETFTPRGVTY